VNDHARTAAITGAYGYLGALVRATLDASGWHTRALVRSPRHDDPDAVTYDLARPVPRDALNSADVLVHCAYDLTLVRRADVERVNVDGSRRLFEGAHAAGVARSLALSTMSAHPATTQLYGRAKLEIETAVHAIGGIAVRPGIVYGARPRGMAGALQQLTRLPVVPVVAGSTRHYVVHEDDFAAALGALAGAPAIAADVVSVAHPEPVPFRSLLDHLARADGRRPRFLPVPWRPVYWTLRAANALRLPVAFRADSLLGLVKPAPNAVGVDAVAALGVTLRPLGGEAEQRAA
jgi:nucleoside-diphosphate-sugar epimerase